MRYAYYMCIVGVALPVFLSWSGKESSMDRLIARATSGDGIVFVRPLARGEIGLLSSLIANDGLDAAMRGMTPDSIAIADEDDDECVASAAAVLMEYLMGLPQVKLEWVQECDGFVPVVSYAGKRVSPLAVAELWFAKRNRSLLFLFQQIVGESDASALRARPMGEFDRGGNSDR
jgi:hypothetical protein